MTNDFKTAWLVLDPMIEPSSAQRREVSLSGLPAFLSAPAVKRIPRLR